MMVQESMHLVTSVLCPNLMASAVTMVARSLHLSGMKGLGNSIGQVSHLDQQRS